MSDEEVQLIDWLGKVGYGSEGSRSGLRQAVSDIARLVNVLEIKDVRNFADEILAKKSSLDTTSDQHSPQKVVINGAGQCAFVVTDESAIRASIQAAISENADSFIICMDDKNSGLAKKIESLIEGVSIVYDNA